MSSRLKENMDVKETSEAVAETNDADIKQELFESEPPDSSTDTMDESITKTDEANNQILSVPTAPEIKFYACENTEEDNNPLLISIIKPEPKISPDLELIKSQVESWRVILQRLPTNTHTDIKQEHMDVDQTDPDDVTTTIPEGIGQHEMKDIKYVNTQDYLDIGETVISEQDRARPGPSSKGDPKNGENGTKKDKVMNKTRTLLKMPEQIKRFSLSYICDHCKKTFNTKMKLQQHISIHYGVSEVNLTCKTCNYRGNTVQTLEIHSRLHDKKRRFKCNLCTYRFITNQYLMRHVQMHTEEKQYKCDLCDYASSRSGDLKIHMRKHTGEKPYKCDLCDYASSRSSHLKSHMRIHTRKKQYKCDLCDYASSYSCDLKRHMSKHTGEKPYQCDFCDYASSYNCDLKRHMSKHTGEKPYKCDICDHTSSHSSHLKSHMRIHMVEKPYKCDSCSFASSYSNYLKQHMSVHTGEKQYKCDFCDYVSSWRGVLKRHMRKHTGEKPYKCDLCEYRCSLSGTLSRHKKRHAAYSAT